MSSSGDSLTFNVNDGCLEAMMHGMRASLLKQQDYHNLAQCQTVDDMKVYLSTQTDYGNFLANEPSPLVAQVLSERATEKFVKEFNELRFFAVQPMAEFLDFVTYDYMISNVLKLITSMKTKSEGSHQNALDIIYKCHPLGMFETIEVLSTQNSVRDMFQLVLVDTPIGPYFKTTDEADLDDHSTAFVREMLQKKYLESFYDFCFQVGGITWEVMSAILEFEADRQVLTITKQSIANPKELPKEDRVLLFPNFGQLVDIQSDLSQVTDEEELKKKVQIFPEYYKMLEQVNKQVSLESMLKKKAVEMYKDAFTQQFQYGAFYAIVKLKEQECQNLLWIAECIKQKQTNRINEYISIYN